MAKPTIQMSSGDDEAPLPPIRSDIQIFTGPEDSFGSPTYNIKDPITGRYYKFNWEQGTILHHFKPGMNAVALARRVSAHTTLKCTSDDVREFFLELSKYGLLNRALSSEEVQTIEKQGQMGWAKWIALHYLYIRIPLVNPDRFLSKTLPFVMPLVSWPVLLLIAVLSITGILGLFQHFEEFLTTFTYFFNLKGVLAFALSLTLVKVIHELSHAYTAKRYGIHVPSMGIILLVFWPVLYTDVTDGWKLYRRSARFAISFAGIAIELALAALATLGWLVSEPGLLQSTFFVIASSTWISTLAMNLNPAMRFDGYYILSDLWGIDNLQGRAFAVTRWRLRSFFLGLNYQAPEAGLSKERITGMMVYSIYTWIYRVFLYVAIALLVYYKFAKVLGILLFALEIAVFFVWPLWSELTSLYKMRARLSWNQRSIATATCIALVVVWLGIPLPRTQQFPAVIVPVSQQLLVTPKGALVEQVFATRGQQVKAGDLIIQLRDPRLETDIKLAQLEIKFLEQQLSNQGMRRGERSKLAETQSELLSAQEELRGLVALEDKLSIHSQINGHLHAWDETLQAGIAVRDQQLLGKVADNRQIKAIAFIPEADLGRSKEMHTASFNINLPHKSIKGQVQSIHRVRTENLGHLALASEYHGELPVIRDENGNLRLIESYFPVEVTLENSDSTVRFGQSGWVSTSSRWDSRITRFGRRVRKIFVREANL